MIFLSFSGLEKDPSSSPKQVDFLAGQSLLSQWTGVQASHPLTKSIVLKERKNGQKKLATCLATLLQNQLNSNVACLATHVQSC